MAAAARANGCTEWSDARPVTPPIHRRPRIGLALGSGAARGWAHFGVLRALLAAGVVPEVVCGTSAGAIVGAAYAAGELDDFEDWVRGMDRRTVMSYMDFNLAGGMLKGERLVAEMRERFQDRAIEALALPFATVATALHSGDEVWLRSGPVADAVRASFALPGLFTPVWHTGRLLVDGGLVNPVPVSLARALGAEVVIAVDLNHDKLARSWRAPEPAPPAPPRSAWVQSLQHGLETLWPGGGNASDAGEGKDAVAQPPPLPSMLSVVSDSIQVMQVRITRSRMAGDPAEVVIAPRLAHLGLLDFHRAAEAIEAGQAATQEVLPLLAELGLATAPPPGRAAPAA